MMPYGDKYIVALLLYHNVILDNQVCRNFVIAAS